MWKLICENGFFWKGRFGEQGEWAWKIDGINLVKTRLRDHFATLKNIASGEQSRNSLPDWRKNGPPTTNGKAAAENRPE